MSDPLDLLEGRLQVWLKDRSLLQRALTHRSFSADHNERLEFLGDSVLNLSVAHLLYEALSDLPEGDLSRVRANLVRQSALHQIALTLGLPDLLRLGEGELRSGGAGRPSILADAVEAIVGAVYLDAGFAPAAALVRRLFDHMPITPGMQAAARDPKTELQEWLQGRKMHLPNYEVQAIHGAAHRQTFEVLCTISQLGLQKTGSGQSRRAGEQAAAAAMLETLKTQGAVAGNADRARRKDRS